MAISLEGGIKSTSPFELFHTSLGYNAMPTVLTQKPLDSQGTFLESNKDLTALEK